jgi:hypothetical protein
MAARKMQASPVEDPPGRRPFAPDRILFQVSPRQWASPGFPAPGQQFIEARGSVIVDPMQHVGEPSLRVDVVELGGDDQAIEKSGALSATIGSGEQPGLAPQRQATQRSFGRVVTRLLSPEGLLVGITFTPQMRKEK